MLRIFVHAMESSHRASIEEKQRRAKETSSLLSSTTSCQGSWEWLARSHLAVREMPSKHETLRLYSKCTRCSTSCKNLVSIASDKCKEELLLDMWRLRCWCMRLRLELWRRVSWDLTGCLLPWSALCFQSASIKNWNQNSVFQCWSRLKIQLIVSPTTRSKIYKMTENQRTGLRFAKCLFSSLTKKTKPSTQRT